MIGGIVPNLYEISIYGNFAPLWEMNHIVTEFKKKKCLNIKHRKKQYVTFGKFVKHTSGLVLLNSD